MSPRAERSQEEDDYEKLGSLAGDIDSLLHTSNFDGYDRDYLPEGCLDSLITAENIKRELDKFTEDLHWLETEDERRKYRETYTKDFRQELGRFIQYQAPKTFATMVLCGLGPLHLLMSMQKCRDTNFNDKSLPISALDSMPEFWTPRIWPRYKLRNFDHEQWKFLAPIFSNDKYQYDYPKNCILPFQIKRADKLTMYNAFSTGHKVMVHARHQKHDCMQAVAIKYIDIVPGDRKTQCDTGVTWDNEARALKSINDIDHDHVIKCIAAIRRGHSHYFMFPWADSDSLQEHWARVPKREPDAVTIQDAITQLRGLADALECLHDRKKSRLNSHGAGTEVGNKLPDAPDVQVQDEHGEVSCSVEVPNDDDIRHGELKPESILCFKNPESSLGMLKIGNMGLAERHINKTQSRKLTTVESYGTILYEPPEAASGHKGFRSQLCDIWSMGCTTLEMIIWVLYGNNKLDDFHSQVKGGAKKLCGYYTIMDSSIGQRAILHPEVRRWIKHLRVKDPECSKDSAFSDLLTVVEEKLLVVSLKPTRESTTKYELEFVSPEGDEMITRYRCTAAEFRDSLDKIIARSKIEPNYLFTGKPRQNVHTPVATSGDSLTPNAAYERAQESENSLRQSDIEVPSNYAYKSVDYALPPLKNWEFNVDNDFAKKLSVHIQSMNSEHRHGTFCNRCRGLNFWAGGFNMGDTMVALQERSEHCDFCRLLAQTCGQNPNVVGGWVQIERKQSNFVLLGDAFPVLSIYRGLNARTPIPIQLGLPQLPPPGSDMFFAILNLWLKDCDKHVNHKGCQVTTKINLPTRLIDVGSQSKPSLRLVETAIDKVSNDVYIALSHPWGDVTKYKPFCTLREDPSEAGRDIRRFKQAIPEDQVPATFGDAIICTRRLGVQYLWIDSICILQGDDGDFNEESKTMEDVYSGAYVVLAASRAHSQKTGFLGPRPQREYVTFQTDAKKLFYVCKTIDHFSKDVIEGSLNKRGWVLQERALARRTIYFTEDQTYFECGQGVRCETLTSMHNNMADFLGDRRFPDKAMRTPSKALKITYFQELYKQYSRLGFSRSQDRPFGIAGLEKRLLNAYSTVGGYGVFDDGNDSNGGLFHRSLLWRRGEADGDDPEMVPIEFDEKRNIHVPSWSWMAYTGGIQYVNPPFQTATWETQDIIPPWTRGNIRHTNSIPDMGVVTIAATVRKYVIAEGESNEAKIVFDRVRPSGSDGHLAYCVIVARSNERRSDNRLRRFYVLLVEPTRKRNVDGEQTYRRIGAGFMPGRYIDLNTGGTSARIV